jgi:hypothetical protein
MANNGDGPDEFSARANQTNREFRAFAYANSIVERTELAQTEWYEHII